MQMLSTLTLSLLRVNCSSPTNSNIKIPSNEALTHSPFLTEILFCTQRQSGLYCHPKNASLRLFCPPNDEWLDTDRSTFEPLPVAIPCPTNRICRSHKKMHEYSELHASTFQNPQCVPSDKTDLYEFCEDKLHDEIKKMRARKSGNFSLNGASVADAVPLETKDHVGAETGMASKVVRQCNPFSDTKPQILQCSISQKQCGLKVKIVWQKRMTGGDLSVPSLTAAISSAPATTSTICIDTREIITEISDCGALHVCRKYQMEEESVSVFCLLLTVDSRSLSVFLQ